MIVCFPVHVHCMEKSDSDMGKKEKQLESLLELKRELLTLSGDDSEWNKQEAKILNNIKAETFSQMSYDLSKIHMNANASYLRSLIARLEFEKQKTFLQTIYNSEHRV